MVAITVILAGVVGTAVFSFADLSENVTAGATFEQSPEGVTVTYATSGTADGIVVLVDGQEVDGAVLKDTGDMVTVTAGEDEEVTAVGYKGTPDNRETENPIVTEEARSDTTGGSDPKVVSGGTSGGTSTVSGLVAINPNISGATVELVDNTGSVLKTTTTDSNGEYSFDVEDTSNKSVSVTVEGFTHPDLTHPLYASAKQTVGESNTVDFNFQNKYTSTVDGSTVYVSNDISETSTKTISTIEQLQALDGKSGVYELISDIDASNTSSWNNGKGFDPITFEGTLDGNNYTVNELSIDRPRELRNFGLIGENKGTITSIGVENVFIIGANNTGGLVGENKGTISDSYATGKVTGVNYVGGLVGENIDKVQNSAVKSDVEVSGTEIVGGVIGKNTDSSIVKNVIVQKCYVHGNKYIGGVTGMSDSVHKKVISDSQVAGFEKYGSLFGVLRAGSKASNCYTVYDSDVSLIGSKSDSVSTDSLYEKPDSDLDTIRALCLT